MDGTKSSDSESCAPLQSKSPPNSPSFIQYSFINNIELLKKTHVLSEPDLRTMTQMKGISYYDSVGLFTIMKLAINNNNCTPKIFKILHYEGYRDTNNTTIIELEVKLR